MLRKETTQKPNLTANKKLSYSVLFLCRRIQITSKICQRRGKDLEKKTLSPKSTTLPTFLLLLFPGMRATLNACLVIPPLFLILDMMKLGHNLTAKTRKSVYLG